jgi:hypothetical protein
VLSVGGYIAHEDGWKAFDLEWQQVMTDFGIEHFHMNTFENRRAQFCASSKGWRVQREQVPPGQQPEAL